MNDIPPRLHSALYDRYRIERELGEGGMATVYLAEDLKHGRRVAIKVLKPELAAVIGAERFLAEIKTMASLQHPHILPLHDSGEADGLLFYVMPFVEGESLRDRLDREHQLSVDEAVRIATNVAEALDYAHAHGVIHRDIKPENILLQAGGPVVSDFGIALAVGAAGESRLTQTGMSLGTPHYMSPEQATGDLNVGPATDIYALGCVLFETLVGQPPYTGSTPQAVLGRIITSDAPLASKERPSVPLHVDGAISKALEKLPADRFPSALGFGDALQDVTFSHGVNKAPVGSSEGFKNRWTMAAAVGTVAIAAGLLGWLLSEEGREAGPIEQQRVLLGSGPERVSELVALRMGLHPTGGGIVFSDTATVEGGPIPIAWWKQRGRLDATRLASMDGAVAPTFSPDGSWVAFVQAGELRREPITGGNEVVLATEVWGGTAQALAWLDDGTIVFENRGFILQRIPADGGAEAETVSTEERTGQPIHAAGLPGSWGVLVSACVNSCPARSRLFLLDLVTDTVVALAEDVVRAWPAPGEKVIYLTRAGDVFWAELDRASRSLGSPTPLFGGVRVSSPGANGEMHVAPDGTAVFVRGTATPDTYSLRIVDRNGRSVGESGYSGDPDYRDHFTGIALSPDGRRLAATITRRALTQVWVTEFPGTRFLPVTPFETDAHRPAWYQDGSRIAYVSWEGGSHLRSARSDGTSVAPDTLPGSRFAASLGRDSLVTGEVDPDGEGMRMDVDTSGHPVRVLDRSSDVEAVSVSPDSRWVAYVSDLTGTRNVYVGPFPDISVSRTLVSTDGGTEPLWSRGGRELFYRRGDGWLVAVQIETGSASTVIGRIPLFDASEYAQNPNWRLYDVLPGDEAFVMLAPGSGGISASDDLVLVENLFAMLDELPRD